MLWLIPGVYFNPISSSQLFVVALLMSDLTLPVFLVLSVTDAIVSTWCLPQCCILFTATVALDYLHPFCEVLGTECDTTSSLGRYSAAELHPKTS